MHVIDRHTRALFQRNKQLQHIDLRSNDVDDGKALCSGLSVRCFSVIP